MNVPNVPAGWLSPTAGDARESKAEVTNAFDPVLGSHISSFLPMPEVMLVSLLIQCERGLHVA